MNLDGASDSKEASLNLSNESLTTAVELNTLDVPPSKPDDDRKPTIIGIYGISGCGKSSLLKRLEDTFDDRFLYFEGSEVLDQVAGDRETFKQSDTETRRTFRASAIECIAVQCIKTCKPGIVAGHATLWDTAQNKAEGISTDFDEYYYTHIIYIEPSAREVEQYRNDDHTRRREKLSVENLRKWQSVERSALLKMCYEKGIVLSITKSLTGDFDRIAQILAHVEGRSKEDNASLVQEKATAAVKAQHPMLQTMLVLDADKTIAPYDIVDLIWPQPDPLRPLPGPLDEKDESPLKTLYEVNGTKYGYNAQSQAAMIFDDHWNNQENFEEDCCRIAAKITLRPEFLQLLNTVQTNDDLGAVIVTCGLRRIWEIVLKSAGVSDNVNVIGAGRFSDVANGNGYVVTPDAKRDIVTYFKTQCHLQTLAFGDSQLDLPMLQAADKGIVVVGAKSGSMPACLSAAIKGEPTSSEHYWQWLMSDATTTMLPSDELHVIGFDAVQSALRPSIHLKHATTLPGSMILATATRDSNVSGPLLQEAHRRVGNFLALHHVAQAIEVEQYQIPHVQGHNTTGHRLKDEKATLIVALMRGGEPMARGVFDAFPTAVFLHAKVPNDVTAVYLRKVTDIILVDAVVNSGKTVMDFVEYLGSAKPKARIHLVTGVMQTECICPGTPFRILLQKHGVGVSALRLSDNKYKGKGGVDTGHRLFNTTTLEDDKEDLSVMEEGDGKDVEEGSQMTTHGDDGVR